MGWVGLTILVAFEASDASIALRRGKQLAGVGGGTRISHCESLFEDDVSSKETKNGESVWIERRTLKMWSV